MADLESNFSRLNARIAQAHKNSSNSAKIIQLIAVSKRHSADSVRILNTLGQCDFAENYLQEALEKKQQLNDLSICWHFIGNIQKNKTRAIAEHFDWVHSVDRVLIAERLSQQRAPEQQALNICLQVNVDNETSKGGFAINELSEAVKRISQLPHLRLRGLMAIPNPAASDAQRLSSMQVMSVQFDALNGAGAAMDCLSMGMSADLEIAIQAGATMLRVGEALFGPRAG